MLNDNKDLENQTDNFGLSLNLDTLQASITNLDNFVEENASPQTRDKIKNKDRLCLHVRSKIEQVNGVYRCDYCWDSNSESFLKILKQKDINQNKPTDNNNQQRERERERERERANLQQ